MLLTQKKRFHVQNQLVKKSYFFVESGLSHVYLIHFFLMVTAETNQAA